MAHAGNPTGLAQQPATSANGLWQALLAIIAVLALGAGMVLIGTTIAAPKSAVAPADSYTQIETQRGGMTLAAGSTSTQAQRGPSTAAAAQILVNTQRGPTTAAAALVYVEDVSSLQAEKNRGGFTSSGQGFAPDYSPGDPGATKVEGAGPHDQARRIGGQ